MERIVEFDNLSNYGSMRRFYLGWLDFIKNHFDKNICNLNNFDISCDMNSYENILKSIFLNISMKLAAFEEDQLKFEKEHVNDKVREEYDNLKKYFLNPSVYYNNNPLIVESITTYLSDTYGEDWQLDYSLNLSELFRELLERFDLHEYAYFLSKESYIVRIPKIFEKIIVHTGMSGTSADKFYQLRNCLAHKDYSFGIGGCYTDGKDIELGLRSLFIKFDNGKIYGQISLEELLEIIKMYETFSLLFSGKKYEVLVSKYSEGIYDRKKYSYKFGKFRDDFYDKFDFKPCLFAKSKDDCDGLNALSNYYHNTELGKTLFDCGYPLISSKEEEISLADKISIDKVKKHYFQFIDERFHYEPCVLLAFEENVNKYYRVINNNFGLLSYMERINFFRNFFSDNIFSSNDQFVRRSILNYYIDEYYQKKDLHFNDENRYFGLNDIGCAPILYGEFLLEYLFFNFNFVKEINAKESIKGESIFRYRGICLDNIDLYYYDDNGKVVSTCPYEIKNDKSTARSKKALIEKDITQIIEAILGIANNNDLIIRDEGKRKSKLCEMRKSLNSINRNYDLNKIIKYIAENFVEANGFNVSKVEDLIIKMFRFEYNSSSFTEEELAIKKCLLKQELPKYKTKRYDLSKFDERIVECNFILSKDDSETIYKDCSSFFAHFRNAITHGNIEINYMDSFLDDGSFDYDNIKFTFYDVCPYSNRKKFEIRNISSKRILELLDEYSWLIMNADNKDFIRECNRNDEIKQLVKKVFSNIGNKIELRI